MKITVNIKDSEIKSAVEYLVENELYDQYEDEVLKKAKVPSKSTLVKELMKDQQVIDAVTQIIQKIDLVDYLYDNLYDYNIKRVRELVNNADNAWQVIQDDREEAARIRSEQAEAAKEEILVQRAIRALERQGYKIVKAWQVMCFAV